MILPSVPEKRFSWLFGSVLRPLCNARMLQKRGTVEPGIWPLDCSDINTQKKFLGRTASMREAGAIPRSLGLVCTCKQTHLEQRGAVNLECESGKMERAMWQWDYFFFISAGIAQ